MPNEKSEKDPKYRSKGNYHTFNEENGIKTGKDFAGTVSLTVPDQSISMREILERYSRGHDITVIPGEYFAEMDADGNMIVPEEFDHIGQMDKMEKVELLDEVKRSIADVQSRVKKRKASKKVAKEQNEGNEKDAKDVLKD